MRPHSSHRLAPGRRPSPRANPTRHKPCDHLRTALAAPNHLRTVHTHLRTLTPAHHNRHPHWPCKTHPQTYVEVPWMARSVAARARQPIGCPNVRLGSSS